MPRDITDTTYSRLTLADLRNPFRTERETEPTRTFPQTFNIETLLDPCDTDIETFLRSANLPYALDAYIRQESNKSK